tara:strand:+ start:686 stop:1531 length:846 start_codon:yes stop_codon:yes gene_type:complete
LKKNNFLNYVFKVLLFIIIIIKLNRRINIKNKLKEKLIRKIKVLGCWTSLDNEITSELLALAGFDFLLIDHEHGYGDSRGITRQVQSLKETECSALVRMPKDDEVYVKKTLDTGVDCLMFPAVNNRKEAENIVEMCRYAPSGYRGIAPGMIRATNYGMNITNYLENIEKNLLIVCQIETSEGVSNIQDIGKVNGVDMLFVGPMDLSTSLGKFGKFDDKLFLETMELAKEKIFKTGKFSGIIPYGNLSWKDLFEIGFDLTTAGTELSILRDSAISILKDFKK